MSIFQSTFRTIRPSFTVRRILLMIAMGFLFGCTNDYEKGNNQSLIVPENHIHSHINGLLLGTRFKSMADLQQFVQVEYYYSDAPMKRWGWNKPTVVLRHESLGSKVVSVLSGGVDQDDFRDARDGDFTDKLQVGLMSPYTVLNRDDLMRVLYLSRRRHHQFGSNDVAFFDLAERMACNIHQYQYDQLSPRDTTEKGFINTFNHITAQALMTSLFSEELADFIADVHERLKPELITGLFTEAQFNDLEEGPVDNYVDMINNEWGQELGKRLQLKYDIDGKTEWTPELLADYLNDVQAYYQESLQLEFVPFRSEDYLIQRFTQKLNIVMGDLPRFVKKEK